jgi:hypothetical protein
MFVLGGTNFYGKIDRVPGLFYVATQFSHIFYVPLIPMGTHLVIEEAHDVALQKAAPVRWGAAKSLGFLLGGQKFRSIRQSFSLRSLLYAWASLSLVIFIILQALDLWRLWRFDLGYELVAVPVWEIGATSLACLAGLWLLRRSSYASEKRALELGRGLGFDDATILSHVRSRKAS